MSVQSITEARLDISTGSGPVHVGKIKATSAHIDTNGTLNPRVTDILAATWHHAVCHQALVTAICPLQCHIAVLW